MDSVFFPHDNNIFLAVPKTPLRTYESYIDRPYCESSFRDIVSLMIDTGHIRGNIIDVGAWIGDNAAPWSAMQTHLVYAIDPSRENCMYTYKIKELNNLKNLMVIEVAVSDKKGVISTNYSLDHASFTQCTSGINKVYSTSLDDLLKESIIEDISFIHLDVEEMELLVLKGAKRVIEKFRPIIVYEIHLTFNQTNNSSIKELLVNHNYNVYIINDILPGCLESCRNVLAIPKESDRDIINEITLHLNSYDYLICLYIKDRVEIIKCKKHSSAYYSYNMLRGNRYSLVLMEKKTKTVLEQYGLKEHLDKCIDYGFNVKDRDDYFLIE